MAVQDEQRKTIAALERWQWKFGGFLTGLNLLIGAVVALISIASSLGAF